jgi:hypothetical protein
MTDSLVALLEALFTLRHNEITVRCPWAFLNSLEGKLTMCTVLVIQQMPTTCVQANDNILEVLPHIILYLSTRRPQNIGSQVT